MALQIVSPQSSSDKKFKPVSAAARMERVVTGLDDLKFAAEYAVDKFTPDEQKRIQRDLLVGVGGNAIPRAHRRRVQRVSWDIEGLNGNLTVGDFVTRILSAIEEWRQRVSHNQRNGHWFVEKIELFDPSLTSWDEKVLVPNGERVMHEDGYKAVQSRIVFGGSGVVDEPVTSDGHRLVSHATFVLSITYADTTPGRDIPFVDGAPVTQSAGIDTAAIEDAVERGAVAAATAAVQALAAVQEPKDSIDLSGVPTHDENGKHIPHFTRVKMAKDAAKS